MKNIKAFTIFAVLCCTQFSFYNPAFTQEQTNQMYKYPDFAYEYLGNDKFERFNRKMFAFNLKLNKYAIRPIHTVWASVMPKYGMDRIKSVHTNLVYPKRLVSCLVQKDFKSSGKETVRFLTNTTIGLGGMYDPAKSLFKIEPVDEDMEQALTKCKIKSGPYLVIPVLSSTTPRDLAGRILDWSLDPSSYVGTPVLAMVKAGFTVNRTSYMQPMIKMIESTYADPYDIARKAYGIENYIKSSNLDRKGVLDTDVQIMEDDNFVKNDDNLEFSETTAEENDETQESVLKVNNSDIDENEVNTDSKVIAKEKDGNKLTVAEIIQGGANIDNIILKNYNSKNSNLMADMILFDYNPQNPVTDSMRTALFDLPGINDSIWTDLSVWNRCFSKKIRTSSVNIVPDRDNYKYKYILQKDKTAPIAIIYPSIGEGVTSYHSVVLAKLFFDEGYSVIIQGSNFQWEFVKSMPEDYRPGLPANDADYLKTVTSKILASLQTKYGCEPREKVVIGTSFGAIATLFLADKEYKNNTLNITKFISINPPIELMYAMKQIDRNTEEWNKNPANLKERVAVTAAKVLKVSQMKDELQDKTIAALPFTEDEAKLITGFIMHQKLSDLIFTIENGSQSRKTDIYNTLYNMDYKDYANKYLANNENKRYDDLNYETSLHSISDYLKNNDNYKIYHTLDDYLVNHQQLKQLKSYSGNKVVLLNNGSHLGFLYRPEFIESLKKDITLKNEILAKVSALNH